MSRYAAKLEQVRALLGSKPEQAKAMCQRLVQAAPNDPYVQHVMSQVWLVLGLTAQALHAAARAAALGPDDPALQVEHAKMLALENRPAEAVTLLRRVLVRDMGHLGANFILALTLEQMELYTEAEAAARVGLTMSHGHERLYPVLAGCLLNLGRIEGAIAVMKGVAERNPVDAGAASGLALMSNYMPGLSPREVVDAHRRYGAIVGGTPCAPTAPRQWNPRKRLRVGLVSPDLRQHSVAYFLEPWLREHDPAALEFMVYQTNRVEDAVTRRLRAWVSGSDGTRTALHRGQWHICDNISDAGLAAKIAADGIDILMDLSGHTHAHSLAAFAARPAPVQVTYLGYPGTTGVEAIDYRIVDSHTDPAGTEAFAVERLWRLDPCFLCYQPPGDAPDVSPATPDRPVTFGSFNTVQKINERVIAVWSKLLAAAPHSRLLLKGGKAEDEGLRTAMRERFANAGVEPDRIDFLPRTAGIREHLDLYARIDIALDPFPYNGTTTTCEALYMGVPVITLAGQMHAGRVGVSLLSCIGEPSLIAADECGYLDAAAALARDADRLSQLRATLRGKLLASPLCDAPAFAQRMQAALRGMWSARCAAEQAP